MANTRLSADLIKKLRKKSKGKEKDAKVVDADFEDVTDSKPKKKDDDKSTGTSA